MIEEMSATLTPNDSTSLLTLACGNTEILSSEHTQLKPLCPHSVLKLLASTINKIGVSFNVSIGVVWKLKYYKSIGADYMYQQAS
jgi:hypothetical protein